MYNLHRSYNVHYPGPVPGYLGTRLQIVQAQLYVMLIKNKNNYCNLYGRRPRCALVQVSQYPVLHKSSIRKLLNKIPGHGVGKLVHGKKRRRLPIFREFITRSEHIIQFFHFMLKFWRRRGQDTSSKSDATGVDVGDEVTGKIAQSVPPVKKERQPDRSRQVGSRERPPTGSRLSHRSDLSRRRLSKPSQAAARYFQTETDAK